MSSVPPLRGKKTAIYTQWKASKWLGKEADKAQAAECGG
jgi:hypothetical protein